MKEFIVSKKIVYTEIVVEAENAGEALREAERRDFDLYEEPRTIYTVEERE